MSEKLSNRRRFFRIEKESVVSIAVVDVLKELNLYPDSRQESRWEISSMQNISACGVLITAQKTFPLGTVVKLNIAMETWNPPYKNKDAFHTLARVVRLEMTQQGLYEIGFEFVGIDPVEKEDLIQYLFQKSPIQRSKQPS